MERQLECGAAGRRRWLTLRPPRCRSLNMDCENQEKDKDGNVLPPGAFNSGSTNNSECGAEEEEEAAVRVRLGFAPPTPQNSPA